MARARNIKPGFFSNDELVELPFETRLLFIGLWTIADREGRLLDRPKKVKMDIFPGDNVDVDACLGQLAASGFIKRYEAAGVRAIQITTWHKHQNPHVKEAPSTIPEPVNLQASIERASDEHQTSTVLASEIPERAGLIPDSLNLIPDSLNDNDNSTGGGYEPPSSPLPDREDSPPSNDPAITLAVSLRKLGVDATFTHPAVLDWVKRQVSIEVLQAAVALAREQKGPAAKIPPNYLLPIVEKLLNPPAPAPGRPIQSAPPAPPRKPQGNEPKGTDESYDEWQARVDAFERAQRGRAA